MAHDVFPRDSIFLATTWRLGNAYCQGEDINSASLPFHDHAGFGEVNNNNNNNY